MGRALFLALILTSLSNVIFAESLKVLIPSDVLTDYQHFLHGRNAIELTDFSGDGSRRDVIEVVLMQQALHLGGIKTPIEFIQHNAYQRILTELRQGRGFIAATSIWLTDLENIEEDVFISHAVINNGEFEVGFYTTPNNKTALSAKKTSDIRGLSAISSKAWLTDWNTLSALRMNKLISISNWSSMVKMVNAGRADVLLAPFQPTKDMSITIDEVKLIPIPRIKIGLQGSRHFGVSKHYPNAKSLFENFNRGLNILIKQGIVQKAYRQSGFFNNNVTHWKTLNLEE